MGAREAVGTVSLVEQCSASCYRGHQHWPEGNATKIHRMGMSSLLMPSLQRGPFGDIYVGHKYPTNQNLSCKSPQNKSS